MTAATTTTSREPAAETQWVNHGTSFSSNSPMSSHHPLLRAAKMLKWVGYSVSGLGLVCVLLGWGLWALIIAALAALIGAQAAMLADEFGLPGALRGVRIENVLTPIRVFLPYYTRLRDVPGYRSSPEKYGGFAVTRDRSVVGILSGTADGSGLLGATTVEERMQPITWAEAVDADEDAIEALRRLKRSRRQFLPVVKHDRLVGIVDERHILEAARSSRLQEGTPTQEGASR